MQPNTAKQKLLKNEPTELNELRCASLGSNEKAPPKTPPVSEDVYDTDYYAHTAGGAEWYDRFVSSRAHNIYPIYRQIIENLRSKPYERVLDIGCGRGEILGILATKCVRAFGLDYSSAALKFASTVRDKFAKDDTIPFHLVRADATALPFAAQHFDHVVLSDVVEHLHDWQLEKLYSECWRVLRPLGSIIVHTWPNLWHTRYTYPIVAKISNLIGIPRPLNHRRPHDEIEHVNEQSPRSLRQGVQNAGFRILKIWCEHNAPLVWSPRSIVYCFFHRSPGLRLFFADHLWVIAIRDGVR